MLLRTRAVVAAGAVVLALTGCEPLDTSGSGSTSGKSTTTSGKSTTTSRKAQSTHRVEYRTGKGTSSPAKRSVVVRSGSVARVTSSGGGKVSCRIVVDGRTVASRSGSASVTCSARVGG